MSTSIEDLKPKGSCPKCGVGYFDKQPHYESADFTIWYVEEWLEWRCDYCDYVIRTKTADAE